MLITIYALFMSLIMLAATIIAIFNETPKRAIQHTTLHPGL